MSLADSNMRLGGLSKTAAASNQGGLHNTVEKRLVVFTRPKMMRVRHLRHYLGLRRLTRLPNPRQKATAPSKTTSRIDCWCTLPQAEAVLRAHNDMRPPIHGSPSLWQECGRDQAVPYAQDHFGEDKIFESSVQQGRGKCRLTLRTCTSELNG